jgi:chaperonin cofactor prefoldin
MSFDRFRRLEHCKAELRSYQLAKKPTAAQAQRLSSSISELLAADFDERVTVTIGTVVIARTNTIAKPSSPSR